MPRKKATQADVARVVGVSQATVSYVLNNQPAAGIATETRRRILDVAGQLGYVRDGLARSLRTGRTLTVASVIPDITNPFYPGFQRGIQNVTDARGYDLILYNTDGQPEQERRALRSLLERRVDGAVLVLFHLGARALRDLLDGGTAVSRLTARRPKDGAFSLDSVYLNNEAAARAATAHLLARGHRRIAHIRGGSGPGPARARGYRLALAEAGVPPVPGYEVGADFTLEGGRDAARALLALPEPPSAVFAANDLMALGALGALREAGRRVPQDVAVVGFDDLPAAALVTPALTTVTQPQQRLGERAAELLFDRLSGRATGGARNEEAPFELIVRAST